MISEAKLQANRQNAQKSTGPRTEEGKRRSSQKGLTHGFTTAQVVIDRFEAQLFPDFARGITTSLNPRNETELALVDQVIASVWRLRRAVRIESEQLRSLCHTPGKTLGERVFEADNDRKLFSMSCHETRIERAMHRCLNLLQRMRESPELFDSNGAPVIPIALESGFTTPEHSPIETVDLLTGQTHELDRLIAQKQDLERVTAKLTDLLKEETHYLNKIASFEPDPPDILRDRILEHAREDLWHTRNQIAEIQAIIATGPPYEIAKPNPTDLQGPKPPANLTLPKPRTAGKPQPKTGASATKTTTKKTTPQKTSNRARPGSPRERKKPSTHNIQRPEQGPSTHGRGQGQRPNTQDLRPNEELTLETKSAQDLSPRAQSQPQSQRPNTQDLRPNRDSTPETRELLPQDTTQNTQDTPPQDTTQNTQDTPSQDTTHKTRDTPPQDTTQKTQDTLSMRQQAALERLRLYQRKLHAARQMPQSEARSKQIYHANHWIDRVKAEEQSTLRTIPDQILTFNPARDLPAP